MQDLIRSNVRVLMASLILVGVSSPAYTASNVTSVNVDADSFGCIREMQPVRHFFVDNLLGDTESTVAAANAPEGAPYPVGSIVQLVPTEAMVTPIKAVTHEPMYTIRPPCRPVLSVMSCHGARSVGCSM